jgi:hypothetical protein
MLKRFARNHPVLFLFSTGACIAGLAVIYWYLACWLPLREFLLALCGLHISIGLGKVQVDAIVCSYRRRHDPTQTLVNALISAVLDANKVRHA